MYSVSKELVNRQFVDVSTIEFPLKVNVVINGNTIVSINIYKFYQLLCSCSCIVNIIFSLPLNMYSLLVKFPLNVFFLCGKVTCTINLDSTFTTF